MAQVQVSLSPLGHELSVPSWGAPQGFVELSKSTNYKVLDDLQMSWGGGKHDYSVRALQSLR